MEAKATQDMSHKLWQITDLIKLIGSFKKEMERATDIEKLNSIEVFQHLVYHIFNPSEFDKGLIIRNTLNEDRLSITICKHKLPAIMISFSAIHKHKRNPYHFDTLCLHLDNNSMDNQRELTTMVLDDNILFHFFSHSKKCRCC